VEAIRKDSWERGLDDALLTALPGGLTAEIEGTFDGAPFFELGVIKLPISDGAIRGWRWQEIRPK
jgi:hypothetical protein